jgi:hypothetical protein
MMAPIRASLPAATSFFMICTSSIPRLVLCTGQPSSAGALWSMLTVASISVLHSMLPQLRPAPPPKQHACACRRACHQFPVAQSAATADLPCFARPNRAAFRLNHQIHHRCLLGTPGIHRLPWVHPELLYRVTLNAAAMPHAHVAMQTLICLAARLAG